MVIHTETVVESVYKESSVISKIDTLLGVEFEDESFQYVKPYLRELKYILILLGVLRERIHHNISLRQHQQHSRLQEVAHYFSLERPFCVVYELKAQLLLFIALFKLGYHVPICKQEDQRVINLRQHVINLYSKLYNSRPSTIFFSRISVDLMSRRISYEQ